jgi:hypothetical protein
MIDERKVMIIQGAALDVVVVCAILVYLIQTLSVLMNLCKSSAH